MKSRIKKGKFKETSSPAETAVKVSKPSSSKSTPNPVNKRIKEVKDSQEQRSTQLSKKSSSQTFSVPYAADEAAFTDDLLQLAERVNLDVELSAVIGGRSVSMFDIWQVVMSKEFGGFQNVSSGNLWPKVAHQLGLNTKKKSGGLDELVSYFQEYEDLLLDFEELAREEDEEDTGEESFRNDSSLLADQLLATAEHITDSVGAEDGGDADVEGQEDLEHEVVEPSQLSSTQKQSQVGSRKRPAPGSSPYTKRQRIDRGKGKELEIPSTPEDLKSPQTARLTLEPSPLKNASFPGSDGSNEEYLEEEEEEEEGLFVPVNGQSVKPPLHHEPETQDFQFPASSPLKSSHLSSSPPLRLRPNHQRQNSNAATRGTAHSSSPNDSSTQSQTESQFQAILDKCIANLIDKGFTQDIVLQALQATTLKVDGDVELVAESLMMEKGIPKNVRGVWTEEDDEMLGFGVESKQYRHVLLKHGTEEIRKRKGFLRDMED